MERMTGPIEIPLSKKKLLLMLAGSVGFILIGFRFIIDPPKISNPYFGDPTLLLLLGIVSILFFGICAVYIARKLPDNKAGLIIDSSGLIDNSSGVSAGRILWSDIQDISVIEIHRQKLIMLQVKNPQDYIDRQKSRFKRKMMQMNFNMYGTPLSITSNSLKIEFNELINILHDQFQVSRK